MHRHVLRSLHMYLASKTADSGHRSSSLEPVKDRARPSGNTTYRVLYALTHGTARSWHDTAWFIYIELINDS
jgi:hypothetical protein